MFYAVFILIIAIALTAHAVWDLVTNPKTHMVVIAVILVGFMLANWL